MKKLIQFLGIWLFVYVCFGLVGIVQTTSPLSEGSLIGSAAIAALVFASYWMGYDKGAEDMKTGKVKKQK